MCMSYEYDRMSDSDKTVRELQNHIDSKSYTHTYTHTHTHAPETPWSIYRHPSEYYMPAASTCNPAPVCSGVNL